MHKPASLVFCLWMALAVGTAQEPANPSATSNSQPAATQARSANPGVSQNAMPAGRANGVQPASQIPAQPLTDQNSPASGSGQPGSEVPASTEMRATLDTPLSTKTSQPGDRFTATISQPVSGSNGVVIPAGARVEGEVSESDQDKAAAFRGKGKLNLRFRDIVLPNGQTIPLAASLVSVNSTNGRVAQKADNESRVESGTQGRTVARDLGTSAGVGTVGGLAFGGPLRGLAIGNLPGGGYVLATNAKTVNLPAQTGMVIRLDQPFTIQ